MAKVLAFVSLLLAAAVAALYFMGVKPQKRALDDSVARQQQETARADQAQQEARRCAQDASSLNSRVAELEALLGELRRTSAELEEQVAAREQELASVRETQDELVAELQEEIADGRIQVERLKGQLRVDMVDEILFDSGEAEVKAAGQAILRRIAEVLAKSDKTVQVQGHTDNVPIRGRLASRYPTNWELSAARAVNVVRFLHERAGLAPDRLSATAHSEHRPRAANDTDQGRRKNRRIEILLGPPAETKASE
jgi:chemotaxis protein MotB